MMPDRAKAWIATLTIATFFVAGVVFPVVVEWVAVLALVLLPFGILAIIYGVVVHFTGWDQ